jgi:hypothetical protein
LGAYWIDNDALEIRDIDAKINVAALISLDNCLIGFSLHPNTDDRPA